MEQEVLRQVRRELADLKAALFLTNPFLAVLLAKMRIALNARVRTVVANRHGETVVNPQFWQQLGSPDAKIFILLHEALHLALRHPWSAQGRDQSLFNVAADLVVNEMLFAHGYRQAPGNPVTAPLVREILRARNILVSSDELRRASSDEIYRLLSSAGAQRVTAQTMEETPLDLDPSAGDPPDPGDQIVQEGFREPGEDPEEYWRAAVAEATVVMHQAGTSPGNLQRIVEEALKPRTNWRRLLHEIMRDAAGRTVVTTWEQPSRRYASFPGIKRLGVQTVWALVDCSGSVTEEMLAGFVAEVWGLARTFRCELRVYPWDARVYAPIRVHSPRQVSLRVASGLRGGGGTMLGPVLREVARRMRPLDLVIIISDGHIADLDDPETRRVYRRIARRAAGIVFLTNGRRPDLPRTRLVTLG